MLYASGGASSEEHSAVSMMGRRLHAKIEHVYRQSAESIRAWLPEPIEIIAVAGSGMASLFTEQHPVAVRYESIDNFPVATVQGHAGEARFLHIEGRSVLLFAGRRHLYEGCSMQEIVAPIALGFLLGATSVLLLNSAGGLHPDMRTGEIMAIADSLALTFRSVRRSWLYATPMAYQNPCSYFDDRWRNDTLARLAAEKVAVREGVYVGVVGPSYETPAEVRMYRKLGAQAIGMSTVHEAEFAYFCGMKVAGCSLISNTLHEVAVSALSHDDVMAAAYGASATIEAWIRAACVEADTRP